MTYHYVPTVTCDHPSDCDASVTVTSAITRPPGWVHVRGRHRETLSRDYCPAHTPAVRSAVTPPGSAA